MDYFSIESNVNSIPITLYEKISEDCIINHQYFLQKIEKTHHQYLRDPSETKLLDIPISVLIQDISSKVPIQTEPKVSSFLSLLDNEDRSI